MNKNRLLIAVVVLAVLIGALVSRQRAREVAGAVEKPTVTLPKITHDEVTKIEIDNPEKKQKVSLERGPKKEGDKEAPAWNVTAPLSAKADASAVESMLDKLSDLKITGIAATRKENHERLKVDAANGVHVKAYGGDKLLLDAYVGSTKSGGSTLRKEGEDAVVALKTPARYAFEKELKFLRDRTVTDVDPATLKSMVLTSAKGTFKFEHPESGWQQAKGEKPIKDFAPTKVDSLATAYAKLHAVDFNDPAESAESAGLSAPLATLVLTPKEGPELKFELGKLDAAASEYVLRASANPLIFRISRFTGDRLIADASAFAEGPKPNDKGMPIAGGGNLPPEILQQLQQQGMMGGGAGAHPPH